VGRRVADDPLTDIGAIGAYVWNRRQMLRHGLAASDLGSEGEVVTKEIEATGQPLKTGWRSRRLHYAGPLLGRSQDESRGEMLAWVN